MRVEPFDFLNSQIRFWRELFESNYSNVIIVFTERRWSDVFVVFTFVVVRLLLSSSNRPCVYNSIVDSCVSSSARSKHVTQTRFTDRPRLENEKFEHCTRAFSRVFVGTVFENKNSNTVLGHFRAYLLELYGEKHRRKSI